MVEQKAKVAIGYTDTPVIPGSCWRVHDAERPQPRVVAPGTASTQDRAGTPPADAVVLLGSNDLSGWEAVKAPGTPAAWTPLADCVEVKPGTGDIQTRAHFGDGQFHLEWAAPAVVKGESQGRGNSGVFLMGCYEIQVLDNFGNPTYADGVCGALYGQFPPLVNACRAPGEWQSYDIIWVAPRFAGDRLVSPAYVTVLQNGVLIHHMQPLQGPTQHRRTAAYAVHPPAGPLKLQDHGDLVRYRNIWFRPLTAYDQQA